MSFSDRVFISVLALAALVAASCPRCCIADDEGAKSETAPQVRVQSVAVLTFKNNTANRDNAWIGAGFAETLTTKLQQVQALTLLERRRIQDLLRENGVDLSKGVDKEIDRIQSILGAEHLLLGSFQMTGDYGDPKSKIKVEARIITTETAQIQNGLSFSVSGLTNNLFDLQTELAAKFCSALGVPFYLSTIQYNDCKNLESYRLFNLANKALAEEQYSRAIELYDKAMSANVGGFFVSAHHNQGEAYIQMAESRENDKEKQKIRSEHLERFEKDAQEAAPALFDLGLAYEKNEMNDKAIQAFQDYLKWAGEKGSLVKWNIPDDHGPFIESIAMDFDKVYVLRPADVTSGMVATTVHKPAYISAYDKKNASIQWKSELQTLGWRSLYSDDEYIYAVGYNNVVSLKKIDGSIRWSSELKSKGSFVREQPIQDDDNIVLAYQDSGSIRSEDGALICMSKNNGDIRWTVNLSARVSLFKLLGIYRGDILVFNYSYSKKYTRLERYSLKNGELLSSIDLELAEEPMSTIYGVLILKDSLYVNTVNKIISYDLNSGILLASPALKKLELLDLGLYENRAFNSDGKLLYLASGGRAAAIDPKTLSIIWQREFHSIAKDIYAYMQPASGNSVYVWFSGDKIYCLDRSSGLIKWKHGPVGIGDLVFWGNEIAFTAASKLQLLDTSSRAFNSNTNKLNAILHIGQLQKKQGKLQEAAISFKKILEVKTDSPEANLKLARTYFDLGFKDDAMRAYFAAITSTLSGSEIRAQIYEELSSLMGLRHFGQTSLRKTWFWKEHNYSSFKRTILSANSREIVLLSGEDDKGFGVDVYDLEKGDITRSLADDVSAAIMVGNRLVYGKGEEIICIGKDADDTLWRLRGHMAAPQHHESTLAYMDDGEVVVADAERGKIILRSSADSFILCPDVLVVFTKQEEGNAKAATIIDLSSQKILWDKSVNPDVNATAGGQSFYEYWNGPGGDGVIIAFDLSDGSKRWEYPMDGPITAVQALQSGSVVQVNYNLTAIDELTGAKTSLNYAFSSNSKISYSENLPLISDVSKNIFNIRGRLFAFDDSTGLINWKMVRGLGAPLLDHFVEGDQVYLMLGKLSTENKSIGFRQYSSRETLFIVFDISDPFRSQARTNWWLNSIDVYFQYLYGGRSQESTLEDYFWIRDEDAITMLSGFFSTEEIIMQFFRQKHDPEKLLKTLRQKGVNVSSFVDVVPLLAKINSKDSNNNLISLLWYSDENVRVEAAKHLSRLDLDAEIFAAFEAKKRQFNPQVLDYLVSTREDSVEILEEALKNPRISKLAFQKLIKTLRDKGLDSFVSFALSSKDKSISEKMLVYIFKNYSIETLKKNDQLMQSAILEICRSINSDLRNEFLRLYTEAPKPEQLHQLQIIFVSAPSIDVKLKVAETFKEYADKNIADDILNCLLGLSSQPRLQLPLIEALGKAGGAKAQQYLEQQAAMTSGPVSAAAKKALKEL